MGLVVVAVQVQDSTFVHDPIVGAVLRFYDLLGAFMTEATTDADGLVSVLLEGTSFGTIYRVRAYKPGCAFGPSEIEVSDPPDPTNSFALEGNIFEVVNSPFPGICRVSGTLVGPDGQPLPNEVIRLVPDGGVPRIYYVGLMTGEINTRSDGQGKVLFDVACGGRYLLEIGAWPELTRLVRVPDKHAGILFADLVFPIPAAVTLDPPDPFTIHVGQTILVTPQVTGSDYADWGTGGEFMACESGDPAVLGVAVQGEQIALTGIAPGVTTLQARHTDRVFRVVPDRTSVWMFNAIVIP